MTSPLTGGCLCGAIRYTVSAAISQLRAGSLDNPAGQPPARPQAAGR